MASSKNILKTESISLKGREKSGMMTRVLTSNSAESGYRFLSWGHLKRGQQEIRFVGITFETSIIHQSRDFS
jgi:hypothetical protein